MAQHVHITSGPDGPGAALLATEWLLTNGRGSYAGSTVVGVHTRKYHGLLVAAVRPPGGRAVMLSTLGEELLVGQRVFPLACFEFDGAFHPRGDRFLTGFDCDRQAALVRFTYRFDELTLCKSIVLARQADAVTVRYELAGRLDEPASLRILPFLAYRHYHGNRRCGDGSSAADAAVVGGMLELRDAAGLLPAVRIEPTGSFAPEPSWWYGFFYRAESDRGENAWEDLFSPGRFELPLVGGPDGLLAGELRAAVEPFSPISFADAVAGQRSHRGNVLTRSTSRQAKQAAAAGREPVATPRAGAWADLALAGDDFLVELPGAPAGGGLAGSAATTVLAGYHWFADWGRDAFIALPGLMLATGCDELARGVLVRFAGSIRRGLVPNRFSDEPGSAGQPCDYNSVDASLWWIHAAFAWARTTGRWGEFDAELLGPARSILDAYHAGTDYRIGVDADGLLACGDERTQLTWMDAMVNNVPVTPRAGKPVEVNALYGHALGLAAERLEAIGQPAAGAYRDRRSRWAESFPAAFASPRGGLYDCIGRDGRPDDSIRPNQLLAVSLGDSPLPGELQRQVVELAREHLLTPFGLRSLAPGEPDYCGRYIGPRHQRDAAYHQGTVWAWLIGPFVEAHLRVNEFSEGAKRQAAAWLAPLLEHMNAAALGQISEIFDGDHPHTPRGCVAQAWSVAEVLRAMALIAG